MKLRGKWSKTMTNVTHRPQMVAIAMSANMGSAATLIDRQPAERHHCGALGRAVRGVPDVLVHRDGGVPLHPDLCAVDVAQGGHGRRRRAGEGRPGDTNVGSGIGMVRGTNGPPRADVAEATCDQFISFPHAHWMLIAAGNLTLCPIQFNSRPKVWGCQRCESKCTLDQNLKWVEPGCILPSGVGSRDLPPHVGSRDSRTQLCGLAMPIRVHRAAQQAQPTATPMHGR